MEKEQKTDNSPHTNGNSRIIFMKKNNFVHEEKYFFS
jgi:hypothetical protein